MNHRLPVTALVFLLAACGAEPPPPPSPVRAVKTIIVSDVSRGQTRRFSGVVEAVDTSTLSFPLAGTIQEVAAAVGDGVRSGELLAALDKTPFELDVEAAAADLERAETDLRQKQLDFDRQRELFEKNWTSQAALDQAQAALEAAQSAVRYADSRLQTARRNLRNAELRAPFDGVVAQRLVEPYQEVSPGQPLFELNAEGALNVAFDIPETEINAVALGQPVTVRFVRPFTPGSAAAGPLLGQGRITELSAVAGTGNAFPATASLLESPPGLRPGMTAEVDVEIAAGTERGFLIPVSALVPEGQPPSGFVFVFDPESGVVRKTAIRVAGVEENLLVVEAGLSVGTIVVVAGVSFLHDGQAVRLMEGV